MKDSNLPQSNIHNKDTPLIPFGARANTPKHSLPMPILPYPIPKPTTVKTPSNHPHFNAGMLQFNPDTYTKTCYAYPINNRGITT